MESFHLNARRDVKILVRQAGFPDEKTQVYEVIPSPNSWGRSCEDNPHAIYSRLTYEIDLYPLHFVPVYFMICQHKTNHAIQL